MKYKGTEDAFQMTVARHLNLSGVLWCHVGNERKTKVKVSKSGKFYTPEGNAMRKKGVKKGVPDILIFDPRGGYGGLAIELKIDYNKPSEHQKEWLKNLQHVGWKVLWSNDLDEVLETIDEYLKEPRTKKQVK